jgi:hypothetical protein
MEAPGIGRVRADGLAILGPDDIALRTEIETEFDTWISAYGAIEVELPRLISIDDAAAIDYFHNFPQLGMAVSGLTDPDAISTRARAGRPVIHTADVESPRFVLPSAACYGLYFALRGTQVPDITLFTLRGDCFRRETHYSGLDRLLGFTQREIVAVGAREPVEHFVRGLHSLMREGAARFGIEADLVPATDPFFETNGARAKMQQLFPVKHELVSSRGVAIASANLHRNFFGERCGIKLADGGAAYTGCLGLGVERWMSELSHRRSSG